MAAAAASSSRSHSEATTRRVGISAIRSVTSWAVRGGRRSALQAGTKVDFADQDGDQLAGGLQKEGLGYEIAADLGDTKSALLPGVLDLYATGGKTLFRIEVNVSGYSLWPPLGSGK